jgi:hypothetical protein
MHKLKKEILGRVCGILNVKEDEGIKDKFVLTICNDIAKGILVVVDTENNAIYSLPPTKQES